MVVTPSAQRLAEVERFALGGVGYGGEPNIGETLTRTIASEPDAIAVFSRLAAHPNPVTRLYAYWALRTLDPARAQQVEKTIAADPTEISFMSGCLGYTEPASKALAYIEQRAPL